jgi:hypothetical protein
MTHHQKVEQLIAELKQKGLSPLIVAPPLFRLFWKLGVNVKPPFFMGFLSLTLMMGLYVGVAVYVALWLMQWLRLWQPQGSALHLGLSALSGLLLGLEFAFLFRKTAKKLGLSHWSSYPEETPND